MAQASTGTLFPTNVVAPISNVFTSIVDEGGTDVVAGPALTAGSFPQSTNAHFFVPSDGTALCNLTFDIPPFPTNAIITSITTSYFLNIVNVNNSTFAGFLKIQNPSNSITLNNDNLQHQFNGPLPTTTQISKSHTFEGDDVNNIAVQGLTTNSSTLTLGLISSDDSPFDEVVKLMSIFLNPGTSFNSPRIIINYNYFPKKVTIKNNIKVKLQNNPIFLTEDGEGNPIFTDFHVKTKIS